MAKVELFSVNERGGPDSFEKSRLPDFVDNLFTVIKLGL
jgi:hypothetical protein